MKNKIKIFLLLPLLTVSCSVEKNTLMSRTFHNTTSHYNIYFNGKESFKKGLNRATENYEEDFSGILPVFYFQNEDISNQIAPEMDRAIEKATKVITLHSIKAKPELKKGPQTEKQKEFYSRKEFNKWVPDNYTLLGKAYVYKQQFKMAIETFKKVVSDYSFDPVHYEALFWMARAYNETKEYRESETILNNLISNKEVPKKYKAGIYSTYADLYIKQNQYAKAVPMLKSALEYSHNKMSRIRYTFILGQLNQEVKNYPEAVKAYQSVIKMNPPYEFTFKAKINMAESFEGGKNKGREIEALLRKMLKDDKNLDFHDQIYYALGNIASIEGKEKEAIQNYQESVKSSTNNFNQKGLSYLALADIFYKKPDYVQAQAYYDSCLQNISPDYEDYDALSLKTKSLTSLVDNLTVYIMEDSLQHLATLPKDELNKIIDTKIEEVIQKEQEELQKQQEAMQDLQYGMSVVNSQSAASQNQPGGSWYFYNLNAKSFGQPEFRMKWGNRKLEDNWRRKNKQTVEIVETTPEETQGDTAAETTKKVLGTKSREYYMQFIPFTDSAMQQSHTKLQNALYNMGLIYENELKDQNEAITSFKELLKRYPEGINTLSASYNLYEIYRDKGNTSEANYYKNFIINNFPDSPRAKLLSDPDYVKGLIAQEKKMNDDYESAFSDYESGKYNAVIQKANAAMRTYEGKDIIPRYRLLKALSIGKLQGNDMLKAELEGIIADYPDHESGKYAQQIINKIYSLSPEVEAADIVEEAKDIYKYSEDEVYYFGLSYSSQTDYNQLNFNLINFNLDNYEMLDLGIQKENIGKNNIILVKSFKNLAAAKAYLQSFENAKASVYNDVKDTQIKTFLISEENLNILRKDRALDKYLLYYKNYYQ